MTQISAYKNGQLVRSHRWSAEIHAWADGNVIEGRAVDSADPWMEISDPAWGRGGVQFRVKPERQVLRYRVALIYDGAWDRNRIVVEEPWLTEARGRPLEGEREFMRWLTNDIEVEL